MRNAYIMGAGKFGEYVYSQLLLYKDNWCVAGYLDSDISKKNSQLDGVKVYHISEIEISDIDCNTVVFIAITRSEGKLELIQQLIGLGFSNIFEVKNGIFFNKESFLTAVGLKEKSVRKYKTGDDGKILPVFGYLETQVMNGCNLRCEGCSHFSNLFETDHVVGYENFKRDMTRLGQICNIRLLRLLGGEPFLNRNLLEYVRVARNMFPEADIRIATNGLLITKCDDNLLKYLSDFDIVLDITLYKPTADLREEIVKRLGDYKVLYHLGKEIVNEFNKVLTENGNNDPVVSIDACERKKCMILKSGNLYRCPISAYVSKYNERYGTSIESEEIFNIYSDSQERLWQLALENPVKPVSTCKYCVRKPVYFSWKQSLQPRKEEWLV